jgi:FeS assembly protein IscX
MWWVSATSKGKAFEGASMSDEVAWDDAARIGILLSKKHPDLNPLAIDLNDLQHYVAELAEFEGDSKTVSADTLEAIRIAWNTEFLDRTQ